MSRDKVVLLILPSQCLCCCCIFDSVLKLALAVVNIEDGSLIFRCAHLYSHTDREQVLRSTSLSFSFWSLHMLVPPYKIFFASLFTYLSSSLPPYISLDITSSRKA